MPVRDKDMAIPEERRKRGFELLKKYRAATGNDKYAAAADAISDILLSVADNEEDGSRVLCAAENDFRSALEGESFAHEG